MAHPTVPVDGDRADLVRRILHLAAAVRHQQDQGIAALGLTPATARALHELDPDRPLPARDLAEQLGCDRSNVTGLTDRLEQAGLVQRRTDPVDRRQKTLVVTDRGRQVRDQVRQVMSDSRLLDGLSTPELTALRDLLRKTSDGGCPPQCDET
ncbi:MarR family winged helix-turn-helix transcriptional regulator [Micromonospora sp. NBS 11-29]|uniref:MarR family winged helix-turn-helix transcriptional regulator n=1 Tax=Micromonospora sp. NBS 11-29 TaxID=1960879 RepID=UPI000B7872B3|nr:MarR family transcriptional regulator [Micromonospora sp. NBS 11-29]